MLPASFAPVHSRTIDVLRHDRLVFVLADKLATDVVFEMCVITCPVLDLTVWGATLAEAEDALAFGFFSLYQNYYLEDDANLAPDAVELKARLHRLILETVQV